MKEKKDSLGDRMKNYENSFRYHLTGRLPIILRIDGCHFHSYTKSCKKPFDTNLTSVMDDTAKALCNSIQGAKLGFVQSDEISILINSYENLNSDSWFSNNLQKIVSVSSSIASATFTSLSDKIFGSMKVATFDSRAFVLPKEEVNNYFLWRQQDCSRNSVQMLARSHFSSNECFKKNVKVLKEMLIQKGSPWEDLPIGQKLGRCIVKKTKTEMLFNKKTNEPVEVTRSFWDVHSNTPNFHDTPDFVNSLI